MNAMEKLIPHRAPMLWLDALTECTDTTARATARFSKDHFAVADGTVLERPSSNAWRKPPLPRSVTARKPPGKTRRCRQRNARRSLAFSHPITRTARYRRSPSTSRT